MQNDILAKTNKRQRILMASKGENIEALIAKNEPEVIAKLIDYEYAQDYYEEWKSHKHGDVRYALACLGRFPEIFINDKNPKVRKAVIENHPEFCIERMNQGKIYQIIHDYIINETNPNVELFKTYIDALKSNSNDIGLVTKYRAMTEAPSTIEKTMNDVQLFESGSPFWTTDLTIKQIQDVLKAREELIQQGYSDFMEYLLTTVREPNYDINYIGQEETALTCYYKLFNFL